MKLRKSCYLLVNQKVTALFVLLFSLLLSARAQFYNGSQLSFGKNRIQYQDFNWTYYRTDQFDVYFYPTGKALAEYTVWKATQFIEDIELRLNFTTNKKLQFIVYNTQSDFRESNFAYDDEDFYNQGGVTNVYGTKIYLYFDGNHAHFDAMIKSGIMNIYAHLLVEGENMGANIAAGTLFDVPDWYYTGLASYFGENWSSQIDERVKDGILTRRFNDIDELSPLDARYAGHSFWKFIADRFGEQAIPMILYATRASRSFERGIYHVTGQPFKSLIVSWFRYYFVIYKKDTKRNLPPENGELKKPKKMRRYQQIRISPNGENYAYVTNEQGQVKIWLKRADAEKPKRIFRRYQKTEDNPDFTFPLLAWHPSGKILGFTTEERGRCYYYPYNIETGKMGEKVLVDVEKITDFSFSNDGKMLLLSAFKNGQSDIYLYSFLARAFTPITNDFYDDYAPRFVNNDQQIVFSSNRPHDTLRLEQTPFYQLEPQHHLDLFLYRYEEKNPLLLRVTATPYSDETAARPINAREILFLSDENGIRNRHLARFDSAISHIDTIIHYAHFAQSAPLSDNAFSILDHDYCAESGVVGEVILRDGRENIYFNSLITNTLPQKNAASSFQTKMQTEQRQRDSIAAAKRLIVPTRRGFFQVRKSDLLRGAAQDSVGARKWGLQGNLFTDGLVFTQQIARNYYVQYSVNQLVTQADFGFLNTSYQQFTGGTSPIYLNAGINALIMIGINDLFENRRITGGFRLSFDLDNTEFMFSYENLTKRLDRQIVLYRQSMKHVINDYFYKQFSNSVFYILKYPFTKLSSVRFTFTGRYERYVMGALDDFSLQAKDENHFWGALKLEYVFDSSKPLYTNLWKGTKLKIFAEYQHRLDKTSKNLFVVGFDARHSVKVFRNMTWVSRLSGSSNWGSNRLVYYMGGADNWIFPKFNRDIWVDITKDYAYQTLATNMRGFEQNIRNGTSFLLFSTELRVPFVQLIARKKVSNGFLNSLQLVIFGDVGTAWTGATPYSDDNCLYTRYIHWGANQTNEVKIKRQVEPFVAGFGAGLRASLFGYFLRLDYAWGVEDFKIANKKGLLLFSVGLDF